MNPAILRLQLGAFAVAILAVLAANLIPLSNLGLFYLRSQDRWLIVIGAILLMFCCVRLRDRQQPIFGNWRSAWVVGSVVALGALAGHYLVLSGYDLSLDEQRASFDTAIFATGQIAAPLPEAWRSNADSLNTLFMLQTDYRAAWVSSYLPMNAALRALIGLVARPEFTGPLMALLGALALFSCVRRIWPDRRDLPVVALLLYLGSGQIWQNGMSSYAMSAHLTFNLLWLSLFLRRTWRADGLAMLVGFAAIGLHQPHFHPLFVFPILCLLPLEKDWRRSLFYAAGYLAAILFWLQWPHWMATAISAGSMPPGDFGLDYFASAIRSFQHVDYLRYSSMVENLLRFIAWQHILLVPLTLVGLAAVRRSPLAAALVAGIALTLIFRFAIQPFQGHGLGYRYLHGLIGSWILLAVFGWAALVRDTGMWRTLLIRTTAASCLILLPIQALMSHAFYSAFSGVSARLDAVDADYAVIGSVDVPYSADLVTNSPFLTNHPLRLLREELDDEARGMICRDGASVALVGRSTLAPIAEYFSTPADKMLDNHNRRLAADLSKRGCRVTFS